MKLEYYSNELKKMMSNDDFSKYLNNPRIITYKELRQYRTIDELLPKKFDYIIILVETKRGEGHWVSLAKKDGSIFFSDSYGMTPAQELSMIPKFVRRMLGQENDEVKRLLNTAKDTYDIHINPWEFQSDKPNVNTCGRWQCFFIYCIQEGFSYEDMRQKVDHCEVKQGKPPDILVVDWFP